MGESTDVDSAGLTREQINKTRKRLSMLVLALGCLLIALGIGRIFKPAVRNTINQPPMGSW